MKNKLFTPSSVRSFFTDDRKMLILVGINTLTLYIGGYYPSTRFFFWADSLFTLLFVAEAYVKVNTYGWKEYWRDNWNKFDFIVTLIAVPSLLNIFVDTGVVTSFILSLRSLRIFKSFRLLKFIPHINELLKGIGLAVRASFIVSAAFVILLLIVSILSSTVFGSTSPELFGDPGLSLFTIFKLFSGDGWSEIPTQIAANSGVYTGRLVRSAFAILFFLGGILGLSLINSIFVDAMAGDNNDEVLRRLDALEKKLDALNSRSPRNEEE